MKVLRGIMVLALLFGMQMQGAWFGLGSKPTETVEQTPGEQLPEKPAEGWTAWATKKLWGKDKEVSVEEQSETSVRVQQEEHRQNKPVEVSPVEHRVSLGSELEKKQSAQSKKSGRFISSSHGRESWNIGQRRQKIELPGTVVRDMETVETDADRAARDAEKDLGLQSENRAVVKFDESDRQLAIVQPTSRARNLNSLLITVPGLTPEFSRSFTVLYSLVKSGFRTEDVLLQIPGARRGESYQVSPEVIGRFLAESGKINEQLFSSFVRDRQVAALLPTRSESGIVDFYGTIERTGKIPANSISRVEKITAGLVKKSEDESVNVPVQKESEKKSAQEQESKSSDRAVVPVTESEQIPVKIDVKHLVDISVPEWLANNMPEEKSVPDAVNAVMQSAADALDTLSSSTTERIEQVTDLTQSLVDKAPEVAKDLKNTIDAISKSTGISKVMKDRLVQVTFKQKVSILLGLALANAIVLGIVELTDKKDIDDALVGLLVIDAVVATGLFTPEEGAGKSSMPALLQSKKSDETSKPAERKSSDVKSDSKKK